MQIICLSLLPPGTSPGDYWPLYDGNGNITEYLDAAGTTVAAHFEYDPFGNTLVNSDTNSYFPIRFSTKYQDFESGMIHYGFRDYESFTGRWPNRDPIEEQGGVNLYGFVENKSIDSYDYLGHRKITFKIAVGPDNGPGGAGEMPSFTNLQKQFQKQLGYVPKKLIWPSLQKPAWSRQDIERVLKMAKENFERENHRKCCNEFIMDAKFTPHVNEVRNHLQGVADRFILLGHGGAASNPQYPNQTGIMLLSGNTVKDPTGEYGLNYAVAEIFPNALPNQQICIGCCWSGALPKQPVNGNNILVIAPNTVAEHAKGEIEGYFQKLIKGLCCDK